MKYTTYGYRINQLSKGDGYNWLFLPGGPGLGSEYLISFCKDLQIPGNVFVLDFPSDGTNTRGQLDVKAWQDGLIDVVKQFEKPIIVTHSFAGMFVLNMPILEHLLAGLVVMNTTSTNSFFEHVQAMQKVYHLPDLIPAASQYHLSPSNETYKEFWKTYKHYCFTKEEMAEGNNMMPRFAFNSSAYYYAIENFYLDYTCRWSPQTLPMMTIASEKDFICPPQTFLQNKTFQRNNIINKLIPKAGHCPWLLYYAEVQHCFNEFLSVLKADKRE